MGKLNNLVDAVKYSIGFVLAKFYRIINKKKIYLIGERKDQCQDNGYFLFDYVRKYHKDKAFFYCITKDSKQLNKIIDLGNIIYYKSLKHYIYYFLAEKLVCAHVGSCTPDTAIVWKMEQYEKFKKDRIFIQHGVIKESIPSLMYENTEFKNFICGGKDEFEFVRDNFGYPKGAVQYIGLPRFDMLHNIKTKNYILVMPTWRKWFGMDDIDESSTGEFENSNYFKTYKSLLNNEKINELLKENNLELIFYPHNEMQRYINLFKSKFENIKIAKVDEYEVQTLLKEAKILITDYSSVAFDFAYMKKPIIYYQFDEKEYFKKHYAKGYFEYRENGFGRVCHDDKKLVEIIENIIENNYKMDGIYKERSERFFELHDSKNCERNYKLITR